MRFLTERGQNVNGQPNIIYVSMDNGTGWLPLHEFVDVCHINLEYSLSGEALVDYLLSQSVPVQLSLCSRPISVLGFLPDFCLTIVLLSYF